MNYKILYEDSDLILLDKPQGLATTPGNEPDLCTLFFNDYPLYQ